MKSIVINIGGSVVFSGKIDKTYINDLKDLLIKICSYHKIYLIIGGGKIAREYIEFGRSQNLNEKILDEIGIDVTRTNAKLFSNILGISNKSIPISTKEALKLNNPIVVMGGTIPGHSTDLVGAELASKLNAEKFIIATNVDGVYDKDPNKYKDAKKFKEINIDSLIEKYGTDWTSAGKNMVIDGPALKIIKESRLSTYVINGKKISELEKVIENKEFNGTEIKI
jgi:uridylate kinase